MSRLPTRRRDAPIHFAERLHKVMANAGLGSRRALETQIRTGLVRVNGQPAATGQSVQAGDRVELGGQEWRVVADAGTSRTLIYNKPEGEVTTRSDPQGRPTVFDRLPRLDDARWVAIGRLDINTTGLLLLTTDGELAHAMMHPSRRVDREYVCRIRGAVTDDQLAALRSGVELEDGTARFNDLERIGSSGSNAWFKVTLLEGRNREVRRLWKSQGLQVSRLKRVRYGAVMLPARLRVGRWIELNAEDQRVLRADVGLGAAPVRLSLTALGRGGSGPRTRRTAPRRSAAGRSRSPDRRERQRRVNKAPGSPTGAGRRPARPSDRSGRR